ncbi:HAD hydrolase-like protein [Flavobacterium sp. SUN052]|uniref:HAD hydrolase-like protein n=1 Tax=Flavobacterium sp. SUN052 TaxID=3002441 RepID=UPI00237EC11B|nr:HAD hydrolase-like protein [Flavobacterium sp. SUN052]MEC4005930.1 HAD hydrolase-like protein [Flavobacterium sp. SUN052]
MENQPKKDIDLKINADTILFFDMDGTLVDTDFANFLSYKNAIQSVIQTDKDIPYNPNERFNRASLKKVVPNLTETDYEKIIQQKEENYKEHLSQTKLNKSVADILIQYSKTNKTVLVTNCREDRALMTLNYHNLTDKFSNIFFRQISDDTNRINKYKNALTSLSLSAQTVIVFENEKPEIEDAIFAGISINNILSL